MKTTTFACFAALFAIAIAIGGCNTTRGIGQDIEAAGETIEKVADETEDRLND